MKLHTNDILVINGHIFTLDDQYTSYDKGYLIIHDGKIIDLGYMADLPSSVSALKVIDAQNRVVMPGLINGHCHSAMTLFRGLADDLPLMTWLQGHIFPAEAQFVSPEMVYWCTKLAAAEMLLSGTTTVADAYFYEEQAAQAFADMGMRAIAAQGVIDFPAPGVPDPSANIAYAESYIDKFLSCESLIKPAVFCHSPYTCSEQTLQLAKQLARDRNIPFFIHVAETSDECEQCSVQHSMSPVAYLHNLGLLDPNTIFVHGVWLDHADLLLIKNTGTKIVTCPESNMKLASGIMPLSSMLELDIEVGVGTDSAASNNNLDLFAEIGSCARLHKAKNSDPTIISARQALTMATHGGAAVLGLLDECGSLEIGKKADVILLNKKVAGLMPFYDVETVVYAGSAAHVQTVIINGEIVVEEKKFVAVDLDEILVRVRELGQKIFS